MEHLPIVIQMVFVLKYHHQNAETLNYCKQAKYASNTALLKLFKGIIRAQGNSLRTI